MTLFSRLSALALAGSFIAYPAGSFAHEAKIGSLILGHPWTRATPARAPVAGGYTKITNAGTESDRLIGGTAEFAGRVEIHEMTMNNGVMTMRHLPTGLEIKAGATVELKPGSFHIMFLDLKQPLKQGEMAKGTLTFEKAGTVAVEFKVESMGAQGAAPGDHAGH